MLIAYNIVMMKPPKLLRDEDGNIDNIGYSMGHVIETLEVLPGAEDVIFKVAEQKAKALVNKYPGTGIQIQEVHS